MASAQGGPTGVSPAVAPAPPAPAAPTIGAVSLTGADRLGVAALAQAYAPFIGQTAEPTTLQTLARTLADAARQRGYLFATAMVPEQPVLLGVVRVQLELGAIDEVRIVGSDNRRLRAILDRLVGPAPTAAVVERQLLLAGDLPGITVTGNRYDRQSGRGVLEVKVRDVAARGSVIVDTFGPKAYGPVRARFNLDLFDVGPEGSQLNVQAIRALDGEELTYGGLRYSLSTAGGAAVIGVAGSLARSEPGGAFTYPLAGESKYAAVFASLNLARSRDASLWLNGEIAYLGVDQSTSGRTFQSDRTLTASVSVSGNRAVGEGRVSGEVGVTRGLRPAERLGAEGRPSARPEASSVFTKATAWVSWFQPIGERSAVRVTAQAQAASRPLPTAQEIGLGGPAYGRAYDFNERFGDQGAMVSAEAQHTLKPVPACDRVQVYGFADAGKVSEHGQQRWGEGALGSVGAGLRLRKGGAELDVAAALPVKTDRFATGDRSPRLTAMLSWKF